MILAPGDTLDGYLIREVIGIGGMGVVYRAEQVALGREVALKVLTPALAQDAEFRERFRREGRHVAALDHPNIVTIYDSGKVDGLLYLAMRLVRGTTLADRLRTDGLDAYETLHVLDPIADALDTAHAAAVIHRDVKPQNILISDGGHPYLADFGVAKGLQTTGSPVTGGFVGSCHYAAPEQVLGDPVTPATDIYALSAVLYQCLAGEVPYAGESDAAVLHSHVSSPPPSVDAQRPGGEALNRIVSRGMAKSAEDRYPSATALVEAVHALVDELPRAQCHEVPAFVTTSGAAGTRRAGTRGPPGESTIPADAHSDPPRQAPELPPAADGGASEPGGHKPKRPARVAKFGAIGVALAVICVGAAVLIVGGANPPPQRFTATAAPFTITYSRPWRTATSRVFGAFALLDGGEHARASSDGPSYLPIELTSDQATLAAGQLATSAPIVGGVPPALVHRFGEPATRSSTTLARHNARAYTWPHARLLAYVLPTQSGEAAIICHAASTTRALRSCHSIALEASVSAGDSLLAPNNDNYLDAISLNTSSEPLNAVSTLTKTNETDGATVQPNLLSPCGRATCEAGEPELTTCDGVSYGRTVWYDFYPDQNGQVVIRANGLPTVIALYRYDTHTLLPQELRCAPGSSYSSNQLFAYVRKGVAYTYQIGGRGHLSGSFQMLFNYGHRNQLPVTPFFTTFFLQGDSAKPGAVKLRRFRFIGLAHGENLSIACASCGGVRIAAGEAQGNTVELTAKPTPIIDRRTRIIIGALSPAHIGRYKVYTYDATSKMLTGLSSGCLAPTVLSVTPADAAHPSALDRVSCPAPLLNPAGAEYVFWRGTDGRLWERWWSGVGWSPPRPLATGVVRSAPAVAVHASGEQDVFFRGTDGTLWETWYTGRWHAPKRIETAQMASAPTAGVDGEGNDYVFWRGPDGGLREMSSSEGHWSGPVPLPSGILGSGPAVAVHPDGSRDVFWRGTNGDLWESSYTGGWRAAHNLGATLESGPTVAVDGAGNEYVFWQGTNRHLWQKTLTNGRWSAPRDINSGWLGSAPTVAAHSNGEQDVFWSGAHGGMWEMWYTTHWSGPLDLGPASIAGAPSAGVDATGKLG